MRRKNKKECHHIIQTKMPAIVFTMQIIYKKLYTKILGKGNYTQCNLDGER